MNIDEKLVDHLAQLSRLSFEAEAKQGIMKDLNRILTFVEQLSEVDTTGVEPLIYMNDDVNILRDDVVKQEISHTEALKNAPRHDSDYFRVPRFVEQ